MQTIEQIAYTPEVAPWIKESDQVSNFLGTVSHGQKLGLFDMDRCIWDADTDVEEIAFTQYGLITDIPAWKEAQQRLKKTGNDSMGAYHPVDLAHMVKTVTPEISAYTGIEEGTPINPDVLQAIGRRVGKHIIDNSLFRPTAIEVLRECESKGIRLAIITASPKDLALGTMEYVSTALNLPEISILGTEVNFDIDGTVSESVLFMGPKKTDILRASKGKGGVPIIGAGDKFLTSDLFVSQCLIKGQINNSTPEAGEEAWELIHRQLTSLRGFPFTE